jgi:hypothetical protein
LKRRTGEVRGISGYIATFPPGVQKILRKIRATVAATAPVEYAARAFGSPWQAAQAIPPVVQQQIQGMERAQQPEQ